MRTHVMRTRRKNQRQTVLTMEPDLATNNTQFNTITEEEEHEITDSDSQEDLLDNPEL